jgi:hypothetical protein
MLVHGPARDIGSSGCLVIPDAQAFLVWKQLMAKPRCSETQNCLQYQYHSPVPLAVLYSEDLQPNPNYRWNPQSELPNGIAIPNPYPPEYQDPTPVALPHPEITWDSELL